MADDEMVYEDEQPEPVDEQGELEQAAEYADEVPEKFRGKSPDELIAMYCNLESDYTRKAQQLREYERQQEEMAMDDEPDMAQERLVPIAEAEFQRLLGLGYQDSLETREAAVMYARQQDALIQQAVAEGVRAQLAPYAEVVAPSLFHRDIAGVLDQAPVYGVEARELAEQVAEAGISPLEWSAAPAAQKEQFIRAAAQQLAYQRFLAGELVSPAAAGTAPPQQPPAGLEAERGGRLGGNPLFAKQVDHLIATMGLSRKAAEDILSEGMRHE